MIPEIYPCILAHSLEEYARKLELVEQSAATWVQVDIMDGQFVPNITVMPHEIQSLSTRLNLEAHIMVYNPERYFSDLTVAGVKRVLLHRESFTSLSELQTVWQKAQDYFNEVGLVLNPETTLGLDELALHPSSIQIMGVHPGASGQPMLLDTIQRVELARSLADGTVLAVDGGVTEENIKALYAAGVSRFVIASHLFSGLNIENNYQHFKQLVTGGV